MNSNEKLNPEELMKLAASMKNGGGGNPDEMAKLLSSRLPEDKKQQVSAILNDKQALEQLLKSDAAQQLMKKLGGK